MALVMLPCDLPWWSSICKRLTLLQQTEDTYVIIEIMQRIHDLCNVSLDPDEDKRDTTIFDGLKNFMLNEMNDAECQHYKTVTLRNLAKRAQTLKQYRPPRGISFSLQQQPDKMKLHYDLIAALLANAFFSTFPKRTEKTHPTLQDFNFTHFFRNLDQNHQKVKFQSFIKYFDWIEEQASSAEAKTSNEANGGNEHAKDEAPVVDENGDAIKISRKVFGGKQWLTIEDWLECNVPLCPLDIKHEGRIDRSHENIVQTVFASSRLGGDLFSDGWSQECLQFTTFPELMAILLYVESLEDNEVMFIEDLRQFNRIITDSSKQIRIESLDEPRKISLCLMDPEDYSSYPVSQFEEDNILRELNKCLLAFRQNSTCPILPSKNPARIDRRLNASMSTASRDSKDRDRQHSVQRRLSPIGESGRNSPKDIAQIVIRQPSTSTKRSSYDSERIANSIDKRRSWLAASPMGGSSSKDGGSNVPSVVTGPTNSGRRGRFIVLGSSGECLPVNRPIVKRQLFAATSQTRTDSNSVYSSCNSSENGDEFNATEDDDKYYSARTSFDDYAEAIDDDDYERKYATELDTPEKRFTFAERLRDALRHSDADYSDSTDDSYAVDISISGSQTEEDGIRIRRGGSRGFVLTEDSIDEDYFMQESLNQEQNWLDKFRNKFVNGPTLRTDTNANITADQKSKFSFDENSSDFSSELEEVYEQFSKWLDDPIIKDNVKALDPRDEAVLNFASSLLKRTLSESFVGVPLTEGCINTTCIPAEENSLQSYQDKQKNRQILNVRSLSLELAKHKHRLAAQLSRKLAEKSSKKTDDKIVNKQRKPSMQWSITSICNQQTINCDEVTVKLTQLNKHRTGLDGLKPVATGNWGCGKRFCGDVQLKLVIQWMAASMSGLPVLIYYTAGHEKLAKLDTVCRVLLDRKWTVAELAAATLDYAKDILDDEENTRSIDSEIESRCLFEKLIGI